ARAEQRIREAIKRDPNQPLAHYYLGMALLEQQRWEEALEALEMEQALRPENPMVRQMCLQVRKAIEQGGTPQICR
ncbi:MAG: tetratricopeptide repeat protein, partial [Spartobacteria bacterium]|nr:tetratricopeptide repeat protein [Spartobacteria bacterium]